MCTAALPPAEECRGIATLKDRPSRHFLRSAYAALLCYSLSSTRQVGSRQVSRQSHARDVGQGKRSYTCSMLLALRGMVCYHLHGTKTPTILNYMTCSASRYAYRTIHVTILPLNADVLGTNASRLLNTGDGNLRRVQSCGTSTCVTHQRPILSVMSSG